MDFDTDTFVVEPKPFIVHGEHSTAMTGGGDSDVAFPATTNRCLDTCGGYATNQGGTVVVEPKAYQCHGSNVGPMGTLRAGDGGLTSGVPFAVTEVVSSLGATGGNRGHRLGAEEAAGGHLVVSFSTKDDGRDCGETAPTLRSMAFDKSRINGGGQVGVVTPQLVVRRLSPRECERLQGMPDDHTLIQYRGKPASDSVRYRAIGNSMAVPVIRQLGERIAAVHCDGD